MQLHGRGGRGARAARAAIPTPHLAELAHHALAAGDHAKALRYARARRRPRARGARLRGGRAPVRARARRARAAAPDRARERAASCCWPPATRSRARAASRPRRRRSSPPRARPIGAPAAELARAALGYGGRIVWQRAGDDQRLVPLLEEALAALGETRPRAAGRLLARLAGALRDQPSLEPRSSLSREAVAHRPRGSATPTCSRTRSSRTSWPPGARTSSGSCRSPTRSATWPGAPARPAPVLDALTLDSVIAWLASPRGGRRVARPPLRHPRRATSRGPLAGGDAGRVWALFRGEFARAERLAERALCQRRGPRARTPTAPTGWRCSSCAASRAAWRRSRR